MRIAFVGKGGSGKTTLAALFTDYTSKTRLPYLAIDGDINMHLPRLIGAPLISNERHLSKPANARAIRDHLRGANARIQKPEHFRKTSPPATGSNILQINDAILSSYYIGSKPLLVVGSYNEEEIGTACYHNNLAILENILSHLDDRSGTVIVDMVAGTDAFSNTLHAQFDLLMLVVEPTQRSLEVYRQYAALAKAAGVGDRLRVVGNKIRSTTDCNFITSQIAAEHLQGFFSDSVLVRATDQTSEPLQVDALEPENRQLLVAIAADLVRHKVDSQKRLLQLHNLHRAYVGQASVRERFGDLTDQIDETYDLPSAN